MMLEKGTMECRQEFVRVIKSMQQVARIGRSTPEHLPSLENEAQRLLFELDSVVHMLLFGVEWHISDPKRKSEVTACMMREFQMPHQETTTDVKFLGSKAVQLRIETGLKALTVLTEECNAARHRSSPERPSRINSDRFSGTN